MANMKSLIVAAAIASAIVLPQAAPADDELAVAAIRNHDWAAAEQQLLTALEKEPGNASRQLNLAWVYAQTGRKAEAAALYREVLKHDRDLMASTPARNGKPLAFLAEKGLALLKNN